VALSPTHSLFASDHAHYAPYSPSSRLFLNPLYADPVLVFGEARVARAAFAESRDGLIDWSQTSREKYEFFRRLYEDFAAKELRRDGDALAADFRSFEEDGGDRLRDHGLFEAVHARWFAEQQWDWREWPEGWRDAARSEAHAFVEGDPTAIQFHVFLQWLADRSFAYAQRTALDAGMRIGLISDLAVGMSPGGSHAWSRQQDLLLGLNIGAPPDLFNTRGQDWGLTGFSPQALIASDYEPFIATLRAAMRRAGGVRIDHAMGLARLWLVPQGASPAEGAYLTYPLDDMLRLIALESHRHRAVVIGEDLGTVEPGFREKIAAAGVAGMDVLWFQRDGEDFMPPADWRHDAVAMTSTHDLPTVAGWWSGADIDTRNALGLANAARETKGRTKDRVCLWTAFREAGVVDADAPTKDAAIAVDAAIAFTGQSPSPLALIPIEDVLGTAEQPNMPGTITEHPNWRRRLTQPADLVLETPRVRARLNTLRKR
jgi:4-alpha-glucanotransferase